MSRTPGLLLASCVTLSCLASSGAAVAEAPWARFRGVNGAGISDADTVPVAWKESDFRWRTRLPGTGHSSPAIWNERLFVTCSDRKTGTRTLVCLDPLEGKPLWHRDFAAKTHSQHQYNDYASCSPAADADHVYMLWATPEQVVLLAAKHSGEEVWRRELGPFKSQHGIGTSPIVVGETVVVANDQDGKASLVAVDRRTGETRWQIDRRSALTPASTPCLHDAGSGPRLVFTSMAHGITAVDPADGRVDWQLEKVFLDRVVASPVSAGGLVVGSFGFGTKGTRMVAVRPMPGRSEPEIVIDLKETVPLTCTPLAFQDRLYCLTDDGRLTCLRLPNGELVWRDKLPSRFFGSPVCVNGRIYVMSMDGEAFVLATGDRFELLARNPIGEPSFATPAVAFGRLYLRTREHVICLGGK